MTFLPWYTLCTTGADECSLFNKHIFLHSITSICETKHNWHVSCCCVSIFKEWYNTLLTDLALPEINDMLCIYILYTKHFRYYFISGESLKPNMSSNFLWHACQPANNMNSLKYSLLIYQEKLLYKSIKAYKIDLFTSKHHKYFNHKLENITQSQATIPIPHSIGM